MPDQLERSLERWVQASLIDANAAERIRVYEAEQAKGHGLRWPVLLALACGALLLAAGVLLFVSAHWDELSPAGRMTVVLLLVAVFHAGGALARVRFEWMALALHALGTMALGAGLALTGQIFHLDTEWPEGALLWAIGAAVGWALLRQWPQVALLALLAPYWLIVEWNRHMRSGVEPAAGCALLACTYLSAQTSGRDDPVRRSLVWIGAIGLIPSVVAVCLSAIASTATQRPIGYIAGVLVSLGLAVVLRGRGALYNAAAAVWVLLLVLIASQRESVLAYAWLMVGSVGLSAWGIAERRGERINLGVAGFAIAVLVFYFSSVMDKIGRSASLIGLGVLFLAGGYGLERVRRRLVASIQEGAR